jgi:hypothetical protein
MSRNCRYMNVARNMLPHKNFRAVYGPSRRRRFRPGVYAGLAYRLEYLLSGPFTGLRPPQFPDTLNLL